MDLSLTSGIKLIEKANIKIQENMLFQQWNAEHIYMKKDDFMSFEDYKNKAFKDVNKKKLSKKDTHELAKKNLAEAEKIRKMFEEGGYISETL